MFEKRCSACGGKIDKKLSIVSYDVRVRPPTRRRADNVAEYTRLHGTSNTGDLVGGYMRDMSANMANAWEEQRGVSAAQYNSHGNRDCLEQVNAAMADAAVRQQNLMAVWVHNKVGKKQKYDYSLQNYDGCLDLPLNNAGVHKVLEALHARNLVIVVSSRLEGRAGFLVPMLLPVDDELVADYVKSLQYQAVLQKAEQEFKASGGYGKDWPVKLKALSKYYINTIIKT